MSASTTSPADTAAPAYAAGFETLDEELPLGALEVEGDIPAWLEGSLIRNGPARFEIGDRAFNHWFDGLSMLHRFAFAGGRVSYANRYLRSRSYRAAEERGEITMSEFGTDPCRSLFKRVQAFFSPQISDNANVNLTRLGDEVIAMTETPLPVIFDPETLEAAGVTSAAPGQHTTAHPHLDPATGEGLFYAVKFGPRTSYLLYARSDSERQRTIAKLPVSRPAYMHSFGMTERYAVLGECPLVVNPLDLAKAGRPFIENYRWEPERGAPFLVIDRSTGELAARVDADPYFCFHHVNAFEADGELVVDLVAYDDDTIVRSLYLSELRSADFDVPNVELRRYRLPLGGGRASSETIAVGFELPRINYGRCNGRPYRYVYGNGPSEDGGFLSRIQKADLSDHSTLEWSEPGVFAGEPVFVPGPGAKAEDGGVVLSVVLDSRAGTSFLLVLDARDLSEIARAGVPHAIPFGFHGQYLSGV
jgi:carotenoid cleavage dioxygenase-like enzyme